MTQRRIHAGEQHPEEWRRDLNPDPLAGQNRGQGDAEGFDQATPTAYELKDLHNRLDGFSDDELKQITVLPEGTRLKQGAVYLDLRSPHPSPFTARGDMSAEEGSRYVPKSEVDYQLWNRLIGVDNPERTGEADEA